MLFSFLFFNFIAKTAAGRALFRCQQKPAHPSHEVLDLAAASACIACFLHVSFTRVGWGANTNK